jgi:hypothetical protein
MEMHVCLNVFHDRAEPPAVGAQITKEAFGTAPNSPRIAPRFLFLGLVGFRFTRIRSFRSTTFARAYARANVVRGRPLAAIQIAQEFGYLKRPGLRPSGAKTSLKLYLRMVNMDAQVINSNITSQILASLYMLKSCIDRCPENEWNEKHNDYPFSQVVFHTLFDFDYLLCDYEEELKVQKFHIVNVEIFNGYEELENRKPTKLYERIFINEYYEHCINKVEVKIKQKTLENLLEPKSDVWKKMTKVERYLNIIRHIQHHAGQLGLRLQFITGKEMEWVSRGID